MKKIILCSMLSITSFGVLPAQTCTPDLSLPDTVFVFPPPYQEGLPGSGITDTACVGMPFETVVQFQIPSFIFVPGIGTVPVNSLDLPTEGALVNAPASMDYVCNPPNCVFQKDSTGCVVMFGTAQAGEEGVYDLKLSATLDLGGLGFPLLLPDGQLVPGNYFLTVKPADSPTCTMVGAEELTNGGLSAYNRPNPLNEFTEIVVSTQTSGQFCFKVTDMFGRPIHQENVFLSTGENKIAFDATALTGGVYFYSLDNDKIYTSGKMAVNRN